MKVHPCLVFVEEQPCDGLVPNTVITLENRAMAMTRNTAMRGAGWRHPDRTLSCFHHDQVQIASSAVTLTSPWLLIHFDLASTLSAVIFFGVVAEPGDMVRNIL